MLSSRRILCRAALSALPLLLSGCFVITGNFNPFRSTPEPLEERTVSGEGKVKVLLLDVDGVIGSQAEEGAFGIRSRPSMTARVREELKQAEKDEWVRAVVLRINSPGGTVTASDTIYHEIMGFKARTHLPVLAQLLDMGTSGAYYVALAADEIVASPTTVTGSIGVVLYGVNFSGLMTKLGIANQTFKSGAHKDIGSPLRPMTPEDAQLIQAALMDMQHRFLSIVHERRPGATPDTLAQVSDGRILMADQALRDGLVDRIGYLQDTLDAANLRVGVPTARVVMYRRSTQYAEDIYSRAAVSPPQVNLVNMDLGALTFLSSPQFLYMWLPQSH